MNRKLLLIIAVILTLAIAVLSVVMFMGRGEGALRFVSTRGGVRSLIDHHGFEVEHYQFRGDPEKVFRDGSREFQSQGWYLESGLRRGTATLFRHELELAVFQSRRWMSSKGSIPGATCEWQVLRHEGFMLGFSRMRRSLGLEEDPVKR